MVYTRAQPGPVEIIDGATGEPMGAADFGLGDTSGLAQEDTQQQMLGEMQGGVAAVPPGAVEQWGGLNGWLGVKVTLTGADSQLLLAGEAGKRAIIGDVYLSMTAATTMTFPDAEFAAAPGDAVLKWSGAAVWDKSATGGNAIVTFGTDVDATIESTAGDVDGWVLIKLVDEPE